MIFTYELAKRIAPYMRSRGFKRKGKRFYYLLNAIAFCVGFEMPTNWVYTWAYILPLYRPSDFIPLDYGSRLGNMPSIMLPVLNKTAPDEEIADWCNLLCSRIEDTILPIFHSIDTPQKLSAYIEKGAEYRKLMSGSELNIEELRIYTHLYLKDYDKLRKAIDRYSRAMENTPLMPHLRQQKADWLREMQQLCDSDEDTINAYLDKAKEKTRKFFP